MPIVTNMIDHTIRKLEGKHLICASLVYCNVVKCVVIDCLFYILVFKVQNIYYHFKQNVNDVLLFNLISANKCRLLLVGTIVVCSEKQTNLKF